MRSCGRGIATAGVATLAVAAGTGGADALVPGRPPARADLSVPSGRLQDVDGVVRGAFVVQAVGGAAAQTSAKLALRAGGRDTVIGRIAVPALARGARRTVRVAGVALPSSIAAGQYRLRVCADGAGKVREASEANNCRIVGSLVVSRVLPAPAAPPPQPEPQPSAPPVATTPQPPAEQPAKTPPSSVPTAPIGDYTVDQVFRHDSPKGPYWLSVPKAYDRSQQTPIQLLVWMHGCEGDGEGDAGWTSIDGDAQRYLALSLGGESGADRCWDMNQDVDKVLAAVADVKTHFNIDPRRVVLAGYSSGGDLAYRTAFLHSAQFAGVLAANTSPFRDTGLTQQQALGSASWKFPVVQLAHLQDGVYPIEGVRQETDAVQADGHPMLRIERAGTHYDDDSQDGTTGTTRDIVKELLPHLEDGWQAPAA